MPNILLYVVDALRADHLDNYGYPFTTAPNLCRLSDNGALFERFFSSETSTGPSMATLATGVDALVHAYPWETPGLPEQLVTFPALLRANDYVTGAVSENPFTPPYLAGAPAYSERVFLEEETGALKGRTAETAIRFMYRYADRPFFLYVHTMECHDGLHPSWGRKARPHSKANGTQRTPAESGYDESIHFADSNFGRVLNALDGLGLAGSTLVVFTSDHGEALGEDGRTGHGYPPFLEQIHVPLIMRWPGKIAPKQRFQPMAGMVDLTPTLLSVAGLPVPAHWKGRNLLSLATGNSSILSEEYVFANQGSGAGPTTAFWRNWKLSRTPDGQTRLADWTRDPLEHENQAAQHPDIAGEMAARLERHMAEQRQLHERIYAPGSEKMTIQIDAKKIEVMEALGYLD